MAYNARSDRGRGCIVNDPHGDCCLVFVATTGRTTTFFFGGANATALRCPRVSCNLTYCTNVYEHNIHAFTHMYINAAVHS